MKSILGADNLLSTGLQMQVWGHALCKKLLLNLGFFCSSQNGHSGIRRNLQRAAFCLATKSYYSGVITLPISLVKHIYQWYLLPIRSDSAIMITLIYSFKNIVLYNGRTCLLSLVNGRKSCSSSKFCSAVLFWHSSIDVAVRVESDNAYEQKVFTTQLIIKSLGENTMEKVLAPEVSCSCNLQQSLFACLSSLCCQLSQYPITETDHQRLFSNLCHLLQSSS